MDVLHLAISILGKAKLMACHFGAFTGNYVNGGFGIFIPDKYVHQT